MLCEHPSGGQPDLQSAGPQSGELPGARGRPRRRVLPHVELRPGNNSTVEIFLLNGLSPILILTDLSQ